MAEVGSTPSRPAARGVAGLKTGVPWAALLRSPLILAPREAVYPRPVSSPAQVRSGSVMTSTRAGPSVASAVLKASVNCSARSTRMPTPPQSVA